MHGHLAKITPISRERLIRRHLDVGVRLKTLAVQAGISLRSFYQWLALYRIGSWAALVDRRKVLDCRGSRWVAEALVKVL